MNVITNMLGLLGVIVVMQVFFHVDNTTDGWRNYIIELRKIVDKILIAALTKRSKTGIGHRLIATGLL